MNADEVLGVLVEYQQLLNCLVNDGRSHIADARLSVFRSDEHFAVFTEFPYFFYAGADFANWFGYAGNCLSSKVETAGYFEGSLIEKVPEASAEESDEFTIWEEWFLDRNEFSVIISGQRFDFHPSNEEYAQAGISFEDKGKQSNLISPGQLLRFLSVALGHPFLFSESELRELIDPSVESAMSLFLQTNQWQHPEFLVDSDDPFFESDWIENIPCWQVLARAIASGDLSEWNSQDTSGFNTDWANLERIYRENNGGYGSDWGEISVNMEMKACIGEIGVLLSRLGELQLPYDLGRNEVVVPKADVKQVRVFCASHSLADDFVDFYAGCDGISMSDVWNGYWIFSFEEIVQRARRGDIRHVDTVGDLPRRVIEFGGDGGGGHLVIAVDGSNTVFFLPSEGSNRDGFWTPMGNNSRPKTVAGSFKDFCLRLKGDVEAFVSQTPGWTYIDDGRV